MVEDSTGLYSGLNRQANPPKSKCLHQLFCFCFESVYAIRDGGGPPSMLLTKASQQRITYDAMHMNNYFICGAAHTFAGNVHVVPASTLYIVGLTYGHGSNRLAHVPVMAQLYII